MPDIARRAAAIGGIETHVYEAGTGRPLLFLHSGLGPLAKGGEYLEQLSRDFRVIAPVHPGFGHFDRPSSINDVGDLAYFYLDLLKAWDLCDIVLVGASFGGWVAAELAVRSTHRIGALVLASPFGIKAGGRESRDFADFFAVEAEERMALEFESEALRAIDYSGLSDDDLLAIARGKEAEAHFGWKPFMHNPALRNWLHRIDVPTILVRGSSDRVVRRANHESFANSIPGARLVEIPSSGHHPHIENPAAFVRVFDALAPAEA